MPDRADLDQETGRQQLAALKAEFEALLASGYGVLSEAVHKCVVGGHFTIPHTHVMIGSPTGVMMLVRKP